MITPPVLCLFMWLSTLFDLKSPPPQQNKIHKKESISQHLPFYKGLRLAILCYEKKKNTVPDLGHSYIYELGHETIAGNGYSWVFMLTMRKCENAFIIRNKNGLNEYTELQGYPAPPAYPCASKTSPLFSLHVNPVAMHLGLVQLLSACCFYKHFLLQVGFSQH